MYFLAQLTADTRFDFSDREPLSLELMKPINLSLVLRQDNERGNVLVRYTEAVTSESDALLAHWENEKWPTNSNARESLAVFFNRHRQLAYATVNEVLKTIRWRIGNISEIQELSHPALSYSRDGEVWVGFPPPTPAGLPRPRIVRAWNSDTIIDESTSLINGDVKCPVALELLQEAYKLTEFAPRSAIVLGVSAFEVAVKTFVTAHVPDSKWLVDSLPSPPALKILCDYAPTLTRKCPLPPKSVRAALKEGIELRNKIAHAGTKGPSYKQLQSILEAIEDVIWLLEWSGGFERAWSFIWGETQSKYIVERLQEQVKDIPALSEKERQQISDAIPSLLHSGQSSPNAVETLSKMHSKLPQHFMDTLTRYMAPKVRNPLLPGDSSEPAGMIQYTLHVPRVPEIG